MSNPPFNSRELSWLDFNRRVLEEAQKQENPVLERLKFLAITASNLDEFFMVRVAYLYDKRKSGNDLPDDSGYTAAQQLEEVLTRALAFETDQQTCLAVLRGEMSANGIHLLEAPQVNDEQWRYLDDYYLDEVYPVITPLAIDPGRPFPLLGNKSLNLAVRLRGEEDEPVYGVVQVPSILPRFVPVPKTGGKAFLPLEQLLIRHLPHLFNAWPVEAWGLFRLTRSADFDIDEDADDLMVEMVRTLKKRKRGRPIRVEMEQDFDSQLYEFFKNLLGVSKKYIFFLPGLLDLAALSKIASLPDEDALRLAPIVPVAAADFVGYDDIFAAIQERDRMVHHPYQSFAHVVELLERAAADPDVLAIKQTLYRVSGNSQVVAALERAAENGKAVTVLVELKARFDEENNIQWARRLERAGCHVIYGLAGLKTHCKVLLVVRREASGIRRYVHLGTGNYNDVTARLYTDIGMFTCRRTFGADASALFNRLTGFSRAGDYRKLVVAPEHMRGFILGRIDAEILAAQQGDPCGISIQANSLLDGQVIRRLYDASNAGVPVRLLIRGICALVPGVQGYSENIRVRSIVGQLLEHSRIYVFENGGDERIYLGSADMMPRNLDRRVELLFPVEEPVLRHRLLDILDIMWQDNTNAREQGPDMVYRAVPRATKAVTAQTTMARLARKRLRLAQEALEAETHNEQPGAKPGAHNEEEE